MHIEFLIEDQSGKKAMDILIPKLLGDEFKYRIHSYKGNGHIPKDLRPKTDANKRILLDQLPRLLRGYGRTPGYDTVVVICDLDDRDKYIFLSELNSILEHCNPKPNVIFCLAIEEFEAWYLGDLKAITNAYPSANNRILNGYKNDSICGTWELLADAVYKGGSRALIKKGRQEIGLQKSIWAQKISFHMNVNDNKSPSFNDMYEQLKRLYINQINGPSNE